jgi:hypothetical protein
METVRSWLTLLSFYTIYFDIPKRPLRIYQRSFIHSSIAVEPFVGHWPFLQFRNLFTQSVGLLGRVISPSQGPYLHTGQHKHRINAHTDIPAVSGIRTHDPSVRVGDASSDRAATVIGIWNISTLYSEVFRLTIVRMRCFKLCGDAGDDY